MTHHVLSFDFDGCLWNEVVSHHHIPQAIKGYLTSHNFTEDESKNLNLASASKLICDTHHQDTEEDKTTKITLLKGLRETVLDCFARSSQDLISRILIDDLSGDEVTLMVGSARQDILMDFDNQLGDRPSCFPCFDELAKHGGYSLDQWLTGDMYALNKTTPQEFNAALKLENEAGNEFSDSLGILKTRVTRSNRTYRHNDESKITMLYAQMHRQSQLNPNEDIVFHFADDRGDILDALHEAFSENPSLIPRNVTLVLHQYTKRLNESEQPLAAEYKVHAEIMGRGSPDHEYADTVLETLQSYPTDFQIHINRRGEQPGERYRLTSRLLASRHKKGSSIQDPLTSDTDIEAKEEEEEEKTSEEPEDTIEKLLTGIYSLRDITRGETKSAVPHTHPMDDQTAHMVAAFYHYAQGLCRAPDTYILGKALELELKHFLDNKLSGIEPETPIHFTLHDDLVKLLIKNNIPDDLINLLARQVLADVSDEAFALDHTEAVVMAIMNDEIRVNEEIKNRFKIKLLETITPNTNDTVCRLIFKIFNSDINVDDEYKDKLKTALLDNSLTHYDFIESIYKSNPSEHRDLMQRAAKSAHSSCRTAIINRPDKEIAFKDGVTAASGIIKDASASMENKITAGRFCVELHRHVLGSSQGFSQKTTREVNAGATQSKIWRRVRGAMLCVAATALVGLMVYTTLASGGIFAPISIAALKITGGASVGLAKGATSLIGLASGLFGTQRLVQHRSKHERMSYLAS